MIKSDIDLVIKKNEEKINNKTGYILGYVTPLEEGFFRGAVKKSFEASALPYSDNILAFEKVVVGSQHLYLVFFHEANDPHIKQIFQKVNPILYSQMRSGFDAHTQNPSLDIKVKISKTFFVNGDHDYISLGEFATPDNPRDR